MALWFGSGTITLQALIDKVSCQPTADTQLMNAPIAPLEVQRPVSGGRVVEGTGAGEGPQVWSQIGEPFHAPRAQKTGKATMQQPALTGDGEAGAIQLLTDIVSDQFCRFRLGSVGIGAENDMTVFPRPSHDNLGAGSLLRVLLSLNVTDTDSTSLGKVWGDDVQRFGQHEIAELQ